MISINNVQPLSSETLFNIFKTEFPAFVNDVLRSNLNVEFAHVADVINISFPEVIEGNAYSLTVSEKSIEVTDHTTEGSYNTELLEKHLLEFLV
ncbi:MAG: hypothetical protein ACQUHE_01440, partial [Bacteroidia bacterium]